MNSSVEKVGVPQVAVHRLAGYLRLLRALDESGIGTISSREMAEGLGTNAAQVRKDLSYLGEFGVRGVGYDVRSLISELSRSLGVDAECKVVILGAGWSGPALFRLGGFDGDDFRCVGVFDSEGGGVGEPVGGLIVRPMAEAGDVIRENAVDIAVLAVPAESAAEVATLAVEGGVKGILNFAPGRLPAFAGVFVHQLDPSAELTVISFHLSRVTSEVGVRG